MNQSGEFRWECQPKAEELLLSLLKDACAENSWIQDLEQDLFLHTSTRLFDWVDHFVVSGTPKLDEALAEAGFIELLAEDGARVLYHPGALLPRVVVRQPHQQRLLGLAVSVESIVEFLQSRGISGDIEGSPLSGFRRCQISVENGVKLWVIERRATHTIVPTIEGPQYLERYHLAAQKWCTRPRSLTDEDEAMRLTLQVAEEMVDLVGKDLAAWIALEGERWYWENRNSAGQVQKRRQDRLGMGWANHDHHTFRSSRHHFQDLVRLWEILGFHCRERFYAGEEAGWGAQVMENSACGIVLFLDIDLAPKELEVDFAHHPLPDLGRLGTIGLWCALHGDSLLKAGMHHLEAQFLYDKLTEDLGELNLAMMNPFSNFPFLKQGFTQGEVWQVDADRIESLRKAGRITEEEAESFLHYGAIGSHLENLERNQGYKGFNQKNVSLIIKKTDPRKHSEAK